MSALPCAYPTLLAETNDKPVVIDIYVIPGSGEILLLNQLKQKRGEEFYDSLVDTSMTNGHRSRRMPVAQRPNTILSIESSTRFTLHRNSDSKGILRKFL